MQPLYIDHRLSDDGEYKNDEEHPSQQFKTSRRAKWSVPVLLWIPHEGQERRMQTVRTAASMTNMSMIIAFPEQKGTLDDKIEVRSELVSWTQEGIFGRAEPSVRRRYADEPYLD